MANQLPPTPSLAKPSDTMPTRLDPEAPLYTPIVATNALCSDKRRTVLLQTVRGIMYNTSNHTTSIEVGLLFNTSSQKAYITEHGQEFGAWWGTTSLIATFGSNRE